MLAIRMQRVGRKGHAMYRLAVQESRRHPSSGSVVAYVGTYDPHTKEAKIQVELAQKYLDNGAQPSPRVVKLLAGAGVKLPSWVNVPGTDKSKTVRHATKLRKNQPKVEKVAEVVPEVIEETEIIEAPESEIAELEDVAPVAEAEPAEAVTEEPESEKVVEAKVDEPAAKK